MTAGPVVYSPNFEKPEPDEQKTQGEINENLQKIRETTLRDGGRPLRGVHAKSHGLLRGELTVLENLPATLAQGLFAKAGKYPVVMRLSTAPGDVLSDKISSPRGLAIKVIGVEGERVAGSEGDVTQDFVLVDGPAFQAPNAAKFLGSLKMLASTTDKMEPAKKAFSAVARGTEAVLEAVGGESVALKSMGGHPMTNLLGETYYSQVPVLFGKYIAKIGVFPADSGLQGLTDAKLENAGDENALRDVVREWFKTHGGTWEVRAQLCTDVEKMPIEDASVVWPEDESPYVTVARITAAPQETWNEEKLTGIDAGLSFSPWHALAAHRPLGSVMRARKSAYELSAKFRAENNHKPVTEPRRIEDVV